MHTRIPFTSGARTRPAFHVRPGVRIAGIALAVLVALGAAAGAARAAEIVPSLGITRAVNGEGGTRVLGGLAFRGHLAPMLLSEIAVEYRREDAFGGLATARMWPVTASLYLAPVPMLYAGGGVGWYNLTLDYTTPLQTSSDTSQEFGVHVGGGLQVPLAPALAVDLNGRYVFLRDQHSALVPDTWNPDFWSTKLGLAVKF